MLSVCLCRNAVMCLAAPGHLTALLCDTCCAPLAATPCRYEFLTPSGDHVALTAAARKGSVYICGASTTAERWQAAGPVFGKVVKSFRIRSQPTIGAL